MYQPIQLKTPTPLLLIVLLLACFTFPQIAQAVSPPPDGGYPNFTTAEGDNALKALTIGLGNTAIGTFSLFSVTTGNFNTAVGAGALDLNLGDSNTATGTAALLFNTTGTLNTAVGAAALEFNETGSLNTANGAFALFSNTTAVNNTAIGYAALYSNTTGTQNTANGVQALYFNTGDANTATGTFALFQNTSGAYNVANGNGALQNNTTSNYNTATGYHALFTNSTGSGNTGDGEEVLLLNTTGSENTASGFQALGENTTGSANTAIGEEALASLTDGNFNIALGSQAGFNLVTGSTYNIDIGNGGVFGESGTIRIGDFKHTKTFIAGIHGVSEGGTGILPVYINSDGQLGTMSSSRRFKNEIKPMDQASESILGLQPITFHYKNDKTGTPQFGLIAEEVEKVNPALVVRDDNGEIYTVRYDAVNAMLLNEFLKEHCKVEQQEATIAQLKSGMESLTAVVKEQASQIRKVSAQLEVSRPAPQTVLNDQ